MDTLGCLLLISFIFLFVFSFLKVRNSKNKFGFIYPYFFAIGAFVWEDLLVFSLLGLVSVLLVFAFGSFNVGLLLFLLFWLVRSAGEVLYFFLQQFLEPKFVPHHIDSHFGLMRKILGDISHQKCLIIMQTLFQSILVLSLFFLTVLLLGWQG